MIFWQRNATYAVQQADALFAELSKSTAAKPENP